mmetsp:Transcript_49701/g.55480  ORF Transcript_49701/g.55480 Transcript_49701/m.55480 type:complete len:96 (+) Transcript_49701:696-983(+)
MILACVGYRRDLKKEELTKIIKIKTIKVDRNEIESEKLGGNYDEGAEEVIMMQIFSCLEKEVIFLSIELESLCNFNILYSKQCTGWRNCSQKNYT